MTPSIQSIRGMNDILPEKTPAWQYLECQLTQIIQSYAYQEIRMPLLENTALFKRAIGDVTDIVEKEMYTFLDRNHESVSLRPEGTASCVRACLQHHLLYNQTQKLWYSGPMFRYERPQKGRYRQFYHLGVETYGFPGIDIELELILMAARFWEVLGIDKSIVLEINTLGTAAERQQYRNRLVDYFKKHLSLLDEDSLRRLENNPLRILDSKKPEMQSIIAAAPRLIDHLTTDSQQRFEQLCHILKSTAIPFRINHRLVRGLDYYNHTVFEWVTEDLGAQGTICAGGRYDTLVSQLGGNPCPAFGFAIGLDRLLLLLEATPHFMEKLQKTTDIFVVLSGEDAETKGRLYIETLRRKISTDYRIAVHCGGGSIKNQLKKADKSGASIALILGETEMINHTIGVKFLREERPQADIAQDIVVDFLSKHKI